MLRKQREERAGAAEKTEVEQKDMVKEDEE
jgi:hypothetical protein